MKKVYTLEQKKEIVNEAVSAKDKSSIAIKYDIHYTTLYSWIRKINNLKGKDYKVTFKLSQEEHRELLNHCKDIGYENDVSSYIRKVLFSKNIATGNPGKIIDELYKARAELNKIGSNLNQIAHYTNFLMNQNYVEKDFAEGVTKALKTFNAASKVHTSLLDKTIRKI